MRCGRALFGFALLVAESAAADPARVAVVPVGPDVERTAAAHLRVERALEAQPGLRLVPSAEVGTRLGGPSVPEDAALATLMSLARTAYLEGRFLDAFHRLGEASEPVLERGAVQAGCDRPSVLLLRSAIQHAIGDGPASEADLRELLALAPDLEAPDWLRADFVPVLERLRARQPSVEVHLQGVTPGARVAVGGRVVGASFRIAAGRHRLVSIAPGFLPLARDLEAEVSATVVLRPVPDPGSAARAALESLLWREASDEAGGALAERLAGDAVLVAGTRADGALRGILLGTGGRLARSPLFEGETADVLLATWAANALARGSFETRAPATSPTPGLASGASPAARPRSAWAIDAGVAGAHRRLRIRGDGAAPFEAGFSGLGPLLALSLEGERWSVRLAGSYATYRVSLAEVELPDESRASVTGGTTLRGELGLERRIAGHGERISLAVGLRGTTEQHQAEDLEDADGAMGFFPSYSRASAGAHLVVAANRGAWRWEGFLALSPLTRWSVPDGSLGRHPTGAPELAAGLAVRGGTRLQWSAAYSVELRAASFQGTAAAPVEPAWVESELRETIHALRWVLRRAF